MSEPTRSLSAEEEAEVRRELAADTFYAMTARTTVRRLLATLDAERVEAEQERPLNVDTLDRLISDHNMLHDGRCDCGDHDDWPMKIDYNRHVAESVVRALSRARKP